MKTSIEVYLCAVSGGGMSYGRTVKALRRFGKRPDDIVLAIARKNGFSEQNLVSHSTSWRYDTDLRSVVLTYLVVEEKVPGEGFVKFVKTNLRSSSGTSTRPAPENITQLDVLCHGLRHIGYIMRKHEWSPGQLTTKFFEGLQTELAGEV